MKQAWTLRLAPALVTALLLALWPRAALAECSAFDLTCPLHDGFYPVVRAAAAMVWTINWVLLLLAYQIDVLRAWIVDEGLSGAYTVVLGQVELTLRGIATLALYVFAICYFLLPWLRVRLVDIRRALTYLGVATLLIQSGGALMSSVEDARSSMSAALLAGTSKLKGADLVAAADGQMGAMDKPIYDGSANGICGSKSLLHRSDGTRHADDLAARFLFADAVDIHCSSRRGPASDLPDAFFENGRYFVVDGLSSLAEAERSRKIQLGLDGTLRQGMGIIPCLVAVLEAAINLLFALALAATWISIPLALLFAFFLHTEGIFATLLRRLVTVLIQSWTVSALLGIALSLLIRAADAGSAVGYLAACVACAGMLWAFCRAAWHSLIEALGAVTISIGQSTGMDLPTPLALFSGGTGQAMRVGQAAYRKIAEQRKKAEQQRDKNPQRRADQPPSKSEGQRIRTGEIADGMNKLEKRDSATTGNRHNTDTPASPHTTERHTTDDAEQPWLPAISPSRVQSLMRELNATRPVDRLDVPATTKSDELPRRATTSAYKENMDVEHESKA